MNRVAEKAVRAQSGMTKPFSESSLGAFSLAQPGLMLRMAARGGSCA